MKGLDDTLDVSAMINNSWHIWWIDTNTWTTRKETKEDIETAIAWAHPAYAALRWDTQLVLPDSGLPIRTGVKAKMIELLWK